MLRATALELFGNGPLDEIARNNRVMSRGEKMTRGLEPEQLYAVCANSLQGLGQVDVIMDVDVGTIVKTLVVHAHLPRTIVVPVLFSVTDGLVGI